MLPFRILERGPADAAQLGDAVDRLHPGQVVVLEGHALALEVGHGRLEVAHVNAPRVCWAVPANSVGYRLKVESPDR
jgi:hypothetical protein